MRSPGKSLQTYFTGPSSPSFDFVASSKGEDASTQTSPLLSFTAVDRPPTENSPKRAKGLMSRQLLRGLSEGVTNAP